MSRGTLSSLVTGMHPVETDPAVEICSISADTLEQICTQIRIQFSDVCTLGDVYQDGDTYSTVCIMSDAGAIEQLKQFLSTSNPDTNFTIVEI
jgi:hypothetical protein